MIILGDNSVGIDEANEQLQRNHHIVVKTLQEALENEALERGGVGALDSLQAPNAAEAMRLSTLRAGQAAAAIQRTNSIQKVSEETAYTQELDDAQKKKFSKMYKDAAIILPMLGELVGKDGRQQILNTLSTTRFFWITLIPGRD